MALASPTSLQHLLTLNVVNKVVSPLPTPSEHSLTPDVSAAAQLQLPYPYLTLSLRPLPNKTEQSLVPDSPTKVTMNLSASAYEQPRMPYAPMKHILASPPEQPRMPHAPLTVPAAAPARRYESPQIPYAPIMPDMAPSVYSSEQPRVPYAQMYVGPRMVAQALSVKQRWVPYSPGKPIEVVSADRSNRASRKCTDSRCPVRHSHRAGRFEKTCRDLPSYIQYLEARLGDIRWLKKPQKDLPGISSVSHFEALNHDMFYLVHDTK